jgi:transcriptional regulator with XRE-family HTH domain|tara:strand:- start:527 stop:778 length:252 start_codon:yes stop_codon:yes gene_type:complete
MAEENDTKTICPVCNGSGEIFISVSSIADRRIKMGLSRYALAELSGITAATIRNIEVAANRPRPSTLEAINQALDKLEIERGT